MSTKELVETPKMIDAVISRIRFICIKAVPQVDPAIMGAITFAVREELGEQLAERELLAKGGQQDLTVDDRLALQRIRDEGYAKGDGAQGVVPMSSGRLEMLMLNAAFCIESPDDVPEETRKAIREGLSDAAHAMQNTRHAAMLSTAPPVERDDSKGENT